jgi:hypothetical protein
LDSVYTPQMVIDGPTEFGGRDSAAANKAIGDAFRTPKVRLNLSLVPVRTGNDSQLQVDIGQLEPSFGIREAEVYIAYALNRAEPRFLLGQCRPQVGTCFCGKEDSQNRRDQER